jgi:excisionase family DNA binding protein
VKLLTIAQVSVLTGHHVQTVHSWRKSGVLRFERVGSVYITTSDEVERFMQQREREGK